MKRFDFSVIIILFSMLVFSSCTNEFVGEFQNSDNSNFLNVITKSSTVVDTTFVSQKFYYEGRTFNYISSFVGDSLVSIDNPEVVELFEFFSTQSSLVKYLHQDGIIEYFNDRETFLNQLSSIVESERIIAEQELAIEPYYTGHPWTTPLPPMDQSDNKIANLWLFDDDNYDDSYTQLDLKLGENQSSISNLRTVDLNDKVTSFVAYVFNHGVLFEMFEDADFQDSSFSFCVFPGNRTVFSGDISFKFGDPSPQIGFCSIASLKNCNVIGNAYDSWNDRISSVRITPL